MDDQAFTKMFLQGPTRTLSLGHTEVASWSVGQGPDLLFVHGWPLWAATFRRLAPFLAPHFRLHFFDLPGAGFSQCADLSKVSVGEHVKTLGAVVKALGLTDYAILAHDSGGAIARLHAATHANANVNAMVLSGTEISGHQGWQLTLMIAMARLGLGKQMIAAMKWPAVRHSPLGFGGCFQDPKYSDGEFKELFLDPMFKNGGDQQLALLQQTDSKAFAGLADAHRAIKAPVRCIWGTEDPFFPLGLAKKMLSEFAGEATLKELKGGRLFVHEDRPEEFAQDALAFLRRVHKPASETLAL